jgi:hypothetical protein
VGYAGVHKYGSAKTMLEKIEFHEIDSWNLMGDTSNMYATVTQGIGGINSDL